MAEEQKLKFDALQPKVALGVAAHADDLDFGMAGTVAKWAEAGTDVYYLILTNGNKGSSDYETDPSELTQIRRQEQRDAAKILGVKDVFFCDYEDGMLEISPDVKRDIVRVIRKVKPEVVLCFDPTMVYSAARGFINHPDHRAAAQSALDAVFPLARDHLSFPELFKDEGLEPHKTAHVLLLNFEATNFYVDISSVIDKKMDALAAHTSQMPNLEQTQQRLKEQAQQIGTSIGVQYAEGFVRIDVAG